MESDAAAAAGISSTALLSEQHSLEDGEPQSGEQQALLDQQSAQDQNTGSTGTPAPLGPPFRFTSVQIDGSTLRISIPCKGTERDVFDGFALSHFGRKSPPGNGALLALY